MLSDIRNTPYPENDKKMYDFTVTSSSCNHLHFSEAWPRYSFEAIRKNKLNNSYLIRGDNFMPPSDSWVKLFSAINIFHQKFQIVRSDWYSFHTIKSNIFSKLIISICVHTPWNVMSFRLLEELGRGASVLDSVFDVRLSRQVLGARDGWHQRLHREERGQVGGVRRHLSRKWLVTNSAKREEQDTCRKPGTPDWWYACIVIC